jgi:hypothetical protein
MPTGFSVSTPNPITTSGIFNVTLNLSPGIVSVVAGELTNAVIGTGLNYNAGTNTLSSTIVSCLDNNYDTYNMVVDKGPDATMVSNANGVLGFKATVANLEYNLVLTLTYQGANGNTNYTETHVSMPVHFRKSSTSGSNVSAPFTHLVQWDDYVFIPHEDTGRSATRTYSWTVKNLALNDAISIWVGGAPAYNGNGDIKVKKANLSITVASCEAFGTNIAPITVA